MGWKPTTHSAMIDTSTDIHFCIIEAVAWRILDDCDANNAVLFDGKKKWLINVTIALCVPVRVHQFPIHLRYVWIQQMSASSQMYMMLQSVPANVCVCLRVACCCCCWHRFRSGNWHLVIYLSIAPKRGRAQWHNGKADDRGVCVCDTPLATMNTRIPEKLQSFEIVAVAFSGWLSEWVMNRFIISTDNCADSLNDIAVIHKHYRKFNMHD